MALALGNKGVWAHQVVEIKARRVIQKIRDTMIHLSGAKCGIKEYFLGSNLTLTKLCYCLTNSLLCRV